MGYIRYVLHVTLYLLRDMFYIIYVKLNHVTNPTPVCAYVLYVYVHLKGVRITWNTCYVIYVMCYMLRVTCCV